MNKLYLRIIIGVSIAIPVAVAVLIFTPLKTGLGYLSWVQNLPAFHAIINSLTAILLVGAAVAIKKKNVSLHRSLMLTCLVLGALFLASYVLYHSSVSTTIFGDLNGDGQLSLEEVTQTGNLRAVYLVVLLSHIILSMVVLPLVLMAFYFALDNQIERHKRIVKFTFPIWLYVSVTGVVVYFMISPYYS